MRPIGFLVRRTWRMKSNDKSRPPVRKAIDHSRARRWHGMAARHLWRQFPPDPGCCAERDSKAGVGHRLAELIVR